MHSFSQLKGPLHMYVYVYVNLTKTNQHSCLSTKAPCPNPIKLQYISAPTIEHGRALTLEATRKIPLTSTAALGTKLSSKTFWCLRSDPKYGPSQSCPCACLSSAFPIFSLSVYLHVGLLSYNNMLWTFFSFCQVNYIQQEL